MNSNCPFYKSIPGIILVFLLLCSCGKSINTEGGLLWEITGNGLKEPSYLFGTNHGMSGDFLDSIHGLYDAFNSVKQIAVESDLSKRNRLDSLELQKMNLPPDTTYRDLLNKRELAVLDSVLLIYFNVNSEKIGLKPIPIAANLTSRMKKRESQKWAKANPYMLDVSNRNTNIDSKLEWMAIFKSYPMVELDSKEWLDQSGIRDMSIFFSSDNLQDQAKELVHSIIELRDDTSLMYIARKSIEAYYEQNLALIDKWNNHPKILKDKKAKSLFYTLTTTRNIFWMDKILSSIKNQPTFIMVGVAHLPGKEGIINLLRKEGYIVKSVKYAHEKIKA
jgi:uncharacterized protein